MSYLSMCFLKKNQNYSIDFFIGFNSILVDIFWERKSLKSHSLLDWKRFRIAVICLLLCYMISLDYYTWMQWNSKQLMKIIYVKPIVILGTKIRLSLSFDPVKQLTDVNHLISKHVYIIPRFALYRILYHLFNKNFETRFFPLYQLRISLKDS